MKRFILGNIVVCAVAGGALAVGADIQRITSCARCGMDTEKFAAGNA